VKPHLTVDEVLRAAAQLLGQSFRAWRQPVNGSDHLVVIATTVAGQTVVLKAGTEANVDAEALRLLESIAAPTPRLLASGPIGSPQDRYFLAIMTFIEGTLLAEATGGPAHHYLAPLMRTMRRVHAATVTDRAGTALNVVNRSPLAWQEHALGILTGEHPEFIWPKIAESPGVDGGVLQKALDFVIQRVRALPMLPTASPLHGDLNPSNVFVHDGGISGIIDWSCACFGDPLFDFARLRLNPFVRSHPEAVARYFLLLDLDPAERVREQTHYLFHLITYVNWYVLDNRPEDVAALMGLLTEALATGAGPGGPGG